MIVRFLQCQDFPAVKYSDFLILSPNICIVSFPCVWKLLKHSILTATWAMVYSNSWHCLTLKCFQIFNHYKMVTFSTIICKSLYFLICKVIILSWESFLKIVVSGHISLILLISSACFLWQWYQSILQFTVC